MLMGSSTMAIMNIFAKLVKTESNINVLELCYFRAFFMLWGCYFHAKYSKVNVINIPKDKSFLILLRSIFGFLSFCFQFVGIYLMPLSIAMVLYFT